MPIDSACIHRARQVGTSRGASRNAQGEYERDAVVGPWIPARVMLRGSVTPKTRGANTSSEARVAQGYELLLAPADETGAPFDDPTASMVFETDCAILDSPTLELNGEPERLNDGVQLIGWLCYGDVPLDRA